MIALCLLGYTSSRHKNNQEKNESNLNKLSTDYTAENMLNGEVTHCGISTIVN